MQIKITDEFIFIKTPYESRHYVQEVLNGVWSKAEKMYRFPKNLHVARELLKAFPSLKNSAKFMSLGKELRQQRDFFIGLKTREDAEGDKRLRPYQRVDVDYLKRVEAAGIFNEPRTGKTPTSIVLMQELGTKKNLVVCPASLIWNWAKEFEKWYPDCEVFVVSGTKQKRMKMYSEYIHPTYTVPPRVIIISKDTLKADIKEHDLFTKHTFDTCFVDEAHFLRNRDTLQSKAIFSIKAKRRYALTGTPAIKHGTDIFGILHFLYPKKYPSYWQFVERYWNLGQDWMGHIEITTEKPYRKQELGELIAINSVQRKRKEVMSWLPDKQYVQIPLVMDTRQQKVYNQMLHEFTTVCEESGTVIDTSGVLAQLTRLRQISLDPELLGLKAPSVKTNALLEWLENNKEPVVIMSMFTSYLKLIKPKIEKLGLAVGEINGQMTNEEKQAAATSFQNGKFDVLLCNIISAGTGFTLDRAETIIFTDRAWNPEENTQAEDRITPTIKENVHKHTIIDLFVEDSVDNLFKHILETKKSLTQIINEGGIQAIQKLVG